MRSEKIDNQKLNGWNDWNLWICMAFKFFPKHNNASPWNQKKWQQQQQTVTTALKTWRKLDEMKNA